MHRKVWFLVAGAAIVSMLLAACAPTVETVVVTAPPGAPQVVTATPVPEEVPEVGITDFADVPGEVLQQVCEDAKAAVEFDDAAGTITVHLQEPVGWFLQYVANSWIGPIDMEWMAANGGWDGDCASWVDYHDPAAEESILFEQENGTGPYTLESWVHGEELSWTAFEDYYRTEPIWEGGASGPARIKRVVVKSVDEWGTRFAMLQTGDTDLTYVPRQYAEQADEMVAEECDYVTEECTVVNPAGSIRLFRGLPEVSARDLFFNFNVNIEGGNPYMGSQELDGSGIPPDFFNDVHIRRAFNYCFDWDIMIEESELGEAEQRMGPIINPMMGYEGDDFIYSFDLDKAAEEFQLADVDQDGIPAGEDEEGDVWTSGFYLVLTYNTGNVQRQTTAEILAANLEQVNENFQIEILAIPWPAYLRGLVDGRLPLFIIGWIEDFHHPHNWVHPYLHPKGAFAEFQHMPEEMAAEYEAMIDAAKVIVDPEEAHAAYNAIQEKAVEDAVDIFLIQPVGRHYEQLWVEDWYYNPGHFGIMPYFWSKSADAPDPETLILTTIGEPETLDPNWSYDTASHESIINFYDPLVWYNREKTDEFVPAVADTWEVSADGLTYTFHIREGVPFHQGGTVEAHDAAYSWWRALLQDRAGGPSWMPLEPLLGTSSIEDYAIDMANQ